MEPYHRLFRYAMWTLVGLIVLAIILKARMLFILVEFGAIIAILILIGVMVYDFVKNRIETRGSYTPPKNAVTPPAPSELNKTTSVKE